MTIRTTTKSFWALPALLSTFVLLLYAHSLRYPFVYDDLWRVATNESIRSFDHPLRFLTDRRTQSSLPALQRDSYRPLVTLSFAVDHALFGQNPAGYRAENILLHALNGVIVFLLGIELLLLSAPAAFLAALVFLVHPVQVESVVWVVERTNVLGQFFLLMAVVCWLRFQRDSKRAWAIGTHSLLALSLLTREIAVVLPVFLFVIDALKGHRKRWAHYAFAGAVVVVFLFLRSFIIGQVKISGFKGGDWLTNLGNVAQIWPRYWRVVFWPSDLRVTYADLIPATGLGQPAVLLGILGLAIYTTALFLTWRRSPRWALALAVIGLFWLPGSNLVPLTTLFAERLLYPLMVGFAWGAGLLFDGLKSRFLRMSFGFLVVFFLAGMTVAQLSVWRSERALWENAVNQAPNAWFGWACYGQELQRLADQPDQQPDDARALYAESEMAFDKALQNGPTTESAANILYLLAKNRLRLGNTAGAAKAAGKAIELRPDLGPLWEAYQRGR